MSGPYRTIRASSFARLLERKSGAVVNEDGPLLALVFAKKYITHAEIFKLDAFNMRKPNYYETQEYFVSRSW